MKVGEGRVRGGASVRSVVSMRSMVRGEGGGEGEGWCKWKECGECEEHGEG